MIETRAVSKWKPFVLPVLKSKVEELHVLGYDQADEENVWDCCLKKVWKKDVELRLHQVVQDIFHLSAGTYMAYLTREFYRNDDLLAQIEAISGLNNE
ncbi:post-transcriptional regulator [Salirhabdus sp. Marseille-P4669]|uniref:post-transcriptional regulator n=1 Tax=Salirhabdus sp. Marseille-P4669 TaxID=2042310 RepID=UPI000C7B876C|nr:post-transcriptional regulator [Salirhabdus sp. Marseille-P4669]